MSNTFASRGQARKPTSSSDIPPIVHEVMQSPGRPLDAATRAFMEPRFGHDLSRVRIHAETAAAESAQGLNARAYTVGQDIFFRRDQYNPATQAGLRLLAHELTHTIQQSDSFPAIATTNREVSAELSEGNSLFLQRTPAEDELFSLSLSDDSAGEKIFSCPDYAGDPKLEACLNDRDRLRPGDRGPSVERVQRGLMRDDVFIGDDGVDGIFGPKTGLGVRNFKAKHNLGFSEYPDVGPGTMKKLDELCAGGSPPKTWPTDEDGGNDIEGCSQIGKRRYNPTDPNCNQGSDTVCDENSGLIRIHNNNHCNTRICTQKHEELHAHDLGDCCAKYRSALEYFKGSMWEKEMRSRWKKWIDKNGPTRAWTECRAYRLDLTCANEELAKIPPTQENRARRDQFEHYLKNMTKQEEKWCRVAPATRPECPFDALEFLWWNP